MTKNLGRIRSGVTFLYRPQGTESQIFEVRMKETIEDSKLSAAVRAAYKRFPYLRARIKLHDDGHYYLEKNPITPIPERRRKLRKLQSAASQQNIVDITFWKCSIYVAFHHSLCDGLGILQFIKTMMYYYLGGKYPRLTPHVPNVRLKDEKPTPTEVAEPTVDGNFAYDPDKVYQVDGRGGFHLPEVDEEENYCRWELTFDEKQFMTVCKYQKTTPVVLMSLLMQRAVLAVHPEAEKVVSNVVCDMRAAIECPDTFHNCVICLPLIYNSFDLSTPISEMGTRLREELRRQREIDSARARASTIKLLADKLDSLPDYEARLKMMQMMSTFVNDTFTMSYLGRIGFGNLEPYIDGIHIYTSGDRGMTIEMLSVDGRMVTDFKQSFSSPLYLEALRKECAAIHLDVQVSEQIFFDIPRDTTGNIGLLERLGDRMKRSISKRTSGEICP